MICNDAMDDLVVPHWEPHRIPIVAVRELTVLEARHLLAENHIRLPPGSKPAKGNQVATKSRGCARRASGCRSLEPGNKSEAHTIS